MIKLSPHEIDKLGSRSNPFFNELSSLPHDQLSESAEEKRRQEERKELGKKDKGNSAKGFKKEQCEFVS